MNSSAILKHVAKAFSESSYLCAPTVDRCLKRRRHQQRYSRTMKSGETQNLQAEAPENSVAMMQRHPLQMCIGGAKVERPDFLFRSAPSRVSEIFKQIRGHARFSLGCKAGPKDP